MRVIASTSSLRVELDDEGRAHFLARRERPTHEAHILREERARQLELGEELAWQPEELSSRRLVSHAPQGETLRAVLDRDHLSRQERFEVARAVGRALIALHKRELIHGHLRPELLWISLDASGCATARWLVTSLLHERVSMAEEAWRMDVSSEL